MAELRCLPWWNGVVAQLVERLVRNEKVRGSTPLGSTILRRYSWPYEEARPVSETFAGDSDEMEPRHQELMS
jgi:hypothetical protein